MQCSENFPWDGGLWFFSCPSAVDKWLNMECWSGDNLKKLCIKLVINTSLQFIQFIHEIEPRRNNGLKYVADFSCLKRRHLKICRQKGVKIYIKYLNWRLKLRWLCVHWDESIMNRVISSNPITLLDVNWNSKTVLPTEVLLSKTSF